MAGRAAGLMQAIDVSPSGAYGAPRPPPAPQPARLPACASASHTPALRNHLDAACDASPRRAGQSTALGMSQANRSDRTRCSGLRGQDLKLPCGMPKRHEAGRSLFCLHLPNAMSQVGRARIQLAKPVDRPHFMSPSRVLWFAYKVHHNDPLAHYPYGGYECEC